ncbi:hypothetical protein R3P38DRAFT_2654258, partial [Favolaschia claudopus]
MDRGEELHFDTYVGPLRDASVGWLWDACKVINNETIIKKAWALCKVREWDLSYECLTSPRIRARLRKEEADNTPFWKELQGKEKHKDLPTEDEDAAEDVMPAIEAEEGPDDSEISPRAVLADVGNKRRGRVSRKKDGGLRSTAQADDLDVEPPAEDDAEEAQDDKPKEMGPGKRAIKPNRLYKGWTRHYDDEDTDVEEEEL